ncbi:unnamed protein product [Cylindrotheca closterium]|uniref:Uncharacterized protein n=1 Tax=Cylindrotheca closterium TaxID=2856 RepID=A0AAD2FTY2_9STRA|nr:unnamed protein product [Cylindrotheca closterium]
MLVKMKTCLILLLKQIKVCSLFKAAERKEIHLGCMIMSSWTVGSRVLDEEGFLGRFPPPVYHDEDGIANVLAMREMIAVGYRITMDTDADNAFIVHCDGKQKT